MFRWAGIRKAVRARLSPSKAVSFFPIVQRELLVAAKSRRMFRLRMAVAIASSALGVLTVVVWSNSGSRAGGESLFGFLSAIFWLLCICSGIFLTADCLSREKREGTLGLLFLTDLKGRDIILGKLASTSLMTVLMVIGALPVLALCVLMGGVTGGELFRTCVALLLTMFFSLSVGMFVSTFLRESAQTGAVTFGLLLAATAGPLILGELIDFWPGQSLEWLNVIRFLSPAYLITRANVQLSSLHQFAFPAATIFLTSGTLLGIASVYVRYTWQDRPRPQTSGSVARILPPSALAALRRKRDRLLDQNPILWLAGAGVWQGRLVAGVFVAIVFTGYVAAPIFMLTTLPFLTSYVLPYLLALSIASHATQFFVQMRQQSALEFLLSTPLTDAEILRGQWLALRRRYLPAAIVLTVSIWLPGSSFGVLPLAREFHDLTGYEFLARLYVTLKTVLLWFAAGWAGINFGLKARRTQFAGLIAMIVGVFIPWVSWCAPEVMTSTVVLVICRESLVGRVRSTITAKLESGQAL